MRDDQFRVEFGQRVREARTNAGFTQGSFGRSLGLTRSSIANLEAGRQGTSADGVMQLAEALGVPPGWLLTGDSTVGVSPEIGLHLRRARRSWAELVTKNRGLGWPDAAECVQLPNYFVDDLDHIIAKLKNSEEITINEETE